LKRRRTTLVLKPTRLISAVCNGFIPANIPLANPRGGREFPS
jgi:hypothetical protein